MEVLGKEIIVVATAAKCSGYLEVCSVLPNSSWDVFRVSHFVRGYTEDYSLFLLDSCLEDLFQVLC